MVIGSNEHNQTYDTCVGVKICENPNLGDLLSCRINYENSTIHLTSQTVLEANRLGYDMDSVIKQIKKFTGATIILGTITDEMIQDAAYLEIMCPTLHNGNSQILAYARATNTTLVTCDKGLAEAAVISGTKVINPDLLLCNKIGLREILFHNIIKTIIIPGIVFVSFSHFMVELFGHTIPNIFLSFFRKVSIVVVVGAALLFATAWLLRALPRNHTKNYTLICFDVFGKESFLDGLRTEFKTNDVAWSFMKEYKKKYSLYNFALVTENSKSEKKTIIRYL